MENLSSELNKLKIDKSKRPQQAPRRGATLLVVLVVLILGALAAVLFLRRPTEAANVEVVHPRVESSAQSAVLNATGYVVAHHKIQVGSKIAGRVAWIGVEKGDRVKQNQVVVRLEDREYRAQFEQARAAYEAAQARLQELQRGRVRKRSCERRRKSRGRRLSCE